MIEMVFSAPDMTTLHDDAIRLGFVDANGNILVNGPTVDGGGYFLNIVGTVYFDTGTTTTNPEGYVIPVMEARPGIWGRLRVNGDGQYIPSFAGTITQYHYSITLGGWTSDGVTLAPDYVATIGVIA